MNSLFVKKGDNVKLLAGKNKGKTGKIISVDPESNRVVVDGCNIIIKHVKPKGAQSPGGINKLAGPINASNVQIICPSCNNATRIASGVGADGKRIRTCKKCGASLDVKTKVEKKTAKKGKKDEAAKVDEKPAKKSAVKEVKEPKAVKNADEAIPTEKAATEKKPVKKKPVEKTVEKSE
jgi:large subunit ribosomal protein L24